MTLPNFLIIGAAKSGTTALYLYLKQHPDIFMTTPKELRYFSYNGPYPKDLHEDYIHRGVTTFKEYEQHFEEVTDEKAIGEASPMYLYVPGTAEKIKETLPDVKLMAILRNPIERAYSAYTHALRDWKEDAGSFRVALEKEPERILAGWGLLWHYTQAGFYYQQLKRYYEVFDSGQIKVILHDDLVSNPRGLLREIFEFLEVDPSFEPDISARPNISGFPKNKKFHAFMYRLFMRPNPFKWLGRRIFSQTLRRKVMVKLREENLERREMSEEVRNKLRTIFREDINRLEQLVGRDLSHWLE